MLNVIESKFEDLSRDEEGLVMFGVGGPIEAWINGISDVLKEEKIILDSNPEVLWKEAIKLETTGGRIDLVLVFKEDAQFDIGRMAMWRLQYGDCCSLKDYVLIYGDQH